MTISSTLSRISAGEEGFFAHVAEVRSNINFTALPPVFQATAQELVLRAEGRGQQDDDWLLTQEIDCLLLAA